MRTWGYDACPACGSTKSKRSATCNACRYGHPDICIWPRVDRSGGPEACWEWTGRKDHHGYGRVEFRGTSRAHQATYALTRGPVPAGLELDHLCRNTSCVNPAHLEAVPHHENLRRSPVMGGWATKRRRPTHCPSGHVYSADNTRVYGGKRACRACDRQRKANQARRVK